MAEDQFISPDNQPYSPQEMPEEGDLGALEVAPDEEEEQRRARETQKQEFTEQEQEFFESGPSPEALAAYQTAQQDEEANEAEAAEADEADAEEVESAAEAAREAETKKTFFYGTLLYLVLTPIATKFLAKPLLAEAASTLFKTFHVPILNANIAKKYAPYPKYKKGIALTLIKAAPYYMLFLLIVFVLTLFIAIAYSACKNGQAADVLGTVSAWYFCRTVFN